MARIYYLKSVQKKIPAGFMPNILGQLKQLAETKLNDAHLPLKALQHTVHHVVWLLS